MSERAFQGKIAVDHKKKLLQLKVGPASFLAPVLTIFAGSAGQEPKVPRWGDSWSLWRREVVLNDLLVIGSVGCDGSSNTLPGRVVSGFKFPRANADSLAMYSWIASTGT